MSVVAAESDW